MLFLSNVTFTGKGVVRTSTCLSEVHDLIRNGPLFILHKERCPHRIPRPVLGQAHTWLLNRLTEHKVESQAQVKLSHQGHLMILNLPTASIHSCSCTLPGARKESVWDKGLSMKSMGRASLGVITRKAYRMLS